MLSYERRMNYVGKVFFDSLFCIHIHYRCLLRLALPCCAANMTVYAANMNNIVHQIGWFIEKRCSFKGEFGQHKYWWRMWAQIPYTYIEQGTLSHIYKP